jgi:hypothetical protein
MRSTLSAAAEAAQAIASGWSVSDPRCVASSEIARIYAVRRDHLRTLPGSHAARLVAEVEELLADLPGSKDLWLRSIRGSGEQHFLVFTTATHEIVGSTSPRF